MELGTFGAILKFALDIENQVSTFYKSAAALPVNRNLGTIFLELSSRGEKRLKTLERIRRENVTEMILESIVGLNSDDYMITTKIPESADDNVLKQLAISIETTLQDFYNTAATKIDFLSEAAYAFELLAEKNAETMKRISS
jgi:rubrerythrin